MELSCNDSQPRLLKKIIFEITTSYFFRSIPLLRRLYFIQKTKETHVWAQCLFDTGLVYLICSYPKTIPSHPHSKIIFSHTVAKV